MDSYPGLKGNVDTDGATPAFAERSSSDRWEVKKRADAAVQGALADAKAKKNAARLALAEKTQDPKKKKKLQQEVDLTDEEKKDIDRAARKAATQQGQNDLFGQSPEANAAQMKAWKQDALSSWRAANVPLTSVSPTDPTQTVSTNSSAVADQLEASGWVDQPASNDDAFAQMYGDHHRGLFERQGKGLKEVSSTYDYNHWRRPLLKALGSNKFFDTAWQPEVNASYINAKGKPENPDPQTDPFWVSSGKYPPGTWAKIKDAEGNYTWAQAKDSNPSMGIGSGGAEQQIEGSPALWSSMHDASGKGAGYSGDGTSGISRAGGKPIGPFTVEVYPGSNGGVSNSNIKPFSPEQREEAGQLLESGKAKSISNPEDLPSVKKANEEKEKKAAAEKAQQEASGNVLLEGYCGANKVLYGPEGHEVGYANTKCIHSGGSYVDHGSQIVRIGPGLDYLSRIGDATKDDLAVVSGALDLDVGGASTQMA